MKGQIRCRLPTICLSHCFIQKDISTKLPGSAMKPSHFKQTFYAVKAGGKY